MVDPKPELSPDRALTMAREWAELDMPLNHEDAMRVVRGLLVREQAARPVLDALEAWDVAWLNGTAGVHAGTALHNALVRYEGTPRAALGGSAEADEPEGVDAAGATPGATRPACAPPAAAPTVAADPAVAGDDTQPDVRSEYRAADLLRQAIADRLGYDRDADWPSDDVMIRALAEAGAPQPDLGPLLRAAEYLAGTSHGSWDEGNGARMVRDAYRMYRARLAGAAGTEEPT